LNEVAMPLADSTDVEWVDLGDLKPYPRNREICGEDPVGDLVLSIKEQGVLEPCHVRQDGTIISGYRRWRAAIQAGMTVVPVFLVRYATPDAETLAIIEHNRRRVKSGLQLFQEGQALKEIFKREARQRQRDAGQAYGKGYPKLQENFPEAKPAPQTWDRIARPRNWAQVNSGTSSRKLALQPRKETPPPGSCCLK
jgi:ParB/RepB/Spo0J family partition protein